MGRRAKKAPVSSVLDIFLSVSSNIPVIISLSRASVVKYKVNSRVEKGSFSCCWIPSHDLFFLTSSSSLLPVNTLDSTTDTIFIILIIVTIRSLRKSVPN